ncbi:MAG: HEAT repeat domain-containing protein [Candidatus Sericytochromatia bacterium]
MWANFLTLLGPDLANSPLASRLLLALAAYILVLLIIALGLVFLTVKLHRSNELKARKWSEMEKNWEPLMAQVLIGAWPVAELHKRIKPEDGLFFVDFLTRYTQRLAGSSREIIEDLAAPWLPRLAERTEDGDDEQRARALFTLSSLAPVHYRVQIARALNDPVPLVAMLAARSLAENQASEYLELLLQRMDRFKAWSQHYLTSMLVQIGQPDQVPLRQALSNPEHPIWIQTVILRALCELNDLEAVPQAVGLLEHDCDQELQAAALDLLGRLGREQHKALVRSKCRDGRFVVRLHAIKALNHLGDASDEELFRELLEDESHWISFQAATGLKTIGSLEILEALAESEHPRAELAQQVLYSLDSDKQLLASAHTSVFAKRVPVWIRATTRRQSSVAWQRVQRVLFHPQTHPEVRMALADAFTPEAAAVMQPVIRRQLELNQESEPAYLYRALHQLNPLAALDTLRQHFFTTSSETARLEILNLLLRHHTPATQNFVQDVRSSLAKGQTYGPEVTQVLEQKLDGFLALPS